MVYDRREAVAPQAEAAPDAASRQGSPPRRRKHGLLPPDPSVRTLIARESVLNTHSVSNTRMRFEHPYAF